MFNYFAVNSITIIFNIFIQHVDFFANKNVLVTGGTGFLGKLLVLKLLTSCPDIGLIYLILRPGKKKPKRVRGANNSEDPSLKKPPVMLSPEERLSSLIRTCPLFDDVRSSNPDCLLKIKVVHGDLLAEDLGLKASVRDVMIKEVNVVFHLAATVK